MWIDVALRKQNIVSEDIRLSGVRTFLRSFRCEFAAADAAARLFFVLVLVLLKNPGGESASPRQH